jgi:hypothetical protein
VLRENTDVALGPDKAPSGISELASVTAERVAAARRSLTTSCKLNPLTTSKSSQNYDKIRSRLQALFMDWSCHRYPIRRRPSRAATRCEAELVREVL